MINQEQTWNNKIIYPKFQAMQSILINADLKFVWDYNQDLLKIPEYHPRVHEVKLIDNIQFRSSGVSYQCHLRDGKNVCIEKDIEVIDYHKMVTSLPFDTMGLTKILPDYIVESCLEKIEDNVTEIQIKHYYSIKNAFVFIINPFIKSKISNETNEMLNSMKREIEKQARI